jgi:hypothetical protein
MGVGVDVDVFMSISSSLLLFLEDGMDLGKVTVGAIPSVAFGLRFEFKGVGDEIGVANKLGVGVGGLRSSEGIVGATWLLIYVTKMIIVVNAAINEIARRCMRWPFSCSRPNIALLSIRRAAHS